MSAQLLPAAARLATLPHETFLRSKRKNFENFPAFVTLLGSMPTKVSLLWAICGLIDLAIPPARWLLLAASISLPLIPQHIASTAAEWACYAWAMVFILDKAISWLISGSIPKLDSLS